MILFNLYKCPVIKILFQYHLYFLRFKTVWHQRLINLALTSLKWQSLNFNSDICFGIHALKHSAEPSSLQGIALKAIRKQTIISVAYFSLILLPAKPLRCLFSGELFSAKWSCLTREVPLPPSSVLSQWLPDM